MTNEDTADERCVLNDLDEVDVSDYTLENRKEDALGLYDQSPASATILAELIDGGDAILLEWWGEDGDGDGADFLGGMTMTTETLREIINDVDTSTSD